jgi:glucose-1-phosphate cytidylyltransferase
MKVVILAGGYGTRINEEAKFRPKPLVEIGGYPIIWHIMKHYSKYGINEFIICCGYKGEMIQEYFKKNKEKWDVKTVDTGVETMTGGRLKKISKYIDNETFCITYGDDLKNIDINELIRFHKKLGKSVTLSAFQPTGRFGLLELDNDNVLKISEKVPGDGYWYNGGYYVVEPNIFEYLENESTIWEKEPLNKLAIENQVSVYKYSGPYQPMDTLEDKKKLEKMWNKDKAYWKS